MEAEAAIFTTKHNINNRLTGKKEVFFLAVVLLAGSILFFANLGNRYLWQDEAETALVSKTILTEGIPRGYDGKNFFSQQGKASYGKDYIWVLDPWLPFYLTALSFKVFGVGTFAARLPFALFGIATIVLLYFFAKTISGDIKTAGTATVLLLLSIPFLLLCRQCRYYSLIAFFSLLGLQGYLMLSEKRRSGSIIFLVSAIVIFHCNHLFCATLLATVFIHSLLCQGQQLAKVFRLCVIAALVNIPWLLWISEMRYTSIFGFSFFNDKFFVFLKTYLNDINLYVFPFWLLLIVIGKYLFLCCKKKDIKSIVFENMYLWKNVFLVVLFIAITILSLSITSPIPYFRYMTQLIPVFCVITAVIVMQVIRPYFKKGILILAILFSVIFYIDYEYGRADSSKEGIKYLNFFDYLEEITHDYDSATEGIAKYLNEHGSSKDTVIITYGDLTLKFYTNMRVLGGLTEEDLLPAKNADWVIIRKYGVGGYDQNVLEYITENIPADNYKQIEIDYPDVKWDNRPSPFFHKFRTVKNEDKVIIYQKRRETGNGR